MTAHDLDAKQTASLDDLQPWIGREHAFAGADAVSLSDIRRKLEVYCFACPLHDDEAVARAHGYDGIVAPVTLTPLWAMPAYWNPGEPPLYGPGMIEKTGGIRIDVPTAYAKGVNSATEWEYVTPLYPGDRLEGNWRLIDVKPRQTRLGDGLFLTTETTIVKRTGELVATNRNTSFRYNEKPRAVAGEKPAPGKNTARENAALENAATEPGVPQPEDVTPPAVDWSVQRRMRDVTAGDELPPLSLWLSYQRIVMSVAVDRMFSGIHHNRDQARGAGFNDIIFNTRSYEMLFEQLLRRWIGLDGRITKLGPFRMSGSSYPDDVVSARGRVTGMTADANGGRVQLAILVVNNRGEAARGDAEVALPE